MANVLTYIDVSGAEILAMNKTRGRVPAARDRHVITAPAQLRLLESEPLRKLKWTGRNVAKKTAAELQAEADAALAESDAQFFNEEHQAAVTDALLDLVNELRGQHSLAPLSLADVETSYNAKLAAARSSRR